jgi:tetratricopeptide (TPR) repeat protein
MHRAAANPTTSPRSFRGGKRMFALMLGSCLLFSSLASGQSDAYSQAEALLQNHRWDDGLALLAPLLKSAPRNVKVLNLAGLALAGKGDSQQAGEYFKRAITLDSRFVPALKNLSFSEFNSGQYSAAEKHLLAAQKWMPGDPMICLYLGEIAYREQKYPHATEEFSRIRDLASRNPNASAHLAISDLHTENRQRALEILDTLPLEGIEPKTLFDLALTLDQAGLSARAIPYFEAVRQAYPDSYEIGFNLMLADLAAKNYGQAIQTGTDLIRRGHETSELNNLLGEAYAGNNEMRRALDAYRRAIALDPDNEDNYLDLASLCLNQREFQAGMTVIHAGLDSHPKSDRLVFLRGLLYAVQDEYELAEKDFKLSAELAPQKDLGFIGLGASYLETGHDAQAMQVLRQRLREKPNDASLLYLWGEGLLRTGAAPGSTAYNEALAALENAARMNPNLCLPHITLGTMYLDEGRNKDAVIQFDQARAIDPKERSAYSHLAVAYRRLGEPGKSKEVLSALKDVIAQERQSTRERMESAPAHSAEQQAGEDRSADAAP